MPASLQEGILAMCLFGLPAMAFVTPHVQLRPFAPSVPDARGAPSLPPRRQQAHTSCMMVAPSTRGAEPNLVEQFQLWLGSIGALKQPATSAATARTPKALDVLNRWQQDAACSLENGMNTEAILEEQARETPGIHRAEAMKAFTEWKKLADVHMNKMIRTGAMLSHMIAQIDEGGAEYLFSLTTSESAVDIQAIAAITSMDIQPSDGGFKTLASLIREQGLSPKEGADEGSLEVVHISEIVAVPRADRNKGVGAELIRRISRWAAASGRLVTIVPTDDEVGKYYKSFGFKDIQVGGLKHCMVYGGQGLDYSTEWERFRMITLDM